METTKELIIFDKLKSLEEYVRKQKVFSLLATFVFVFLTTQTKENLQIILSLLSLFFLIRSLRCDLAFKLFNHGAAQLAKYLYCIGEYKEAIFWLYRIKKAVYSKELNNFVSELISKHNFSKDDYKKMIKPYKKRKLKKLIGPEHFDQRILFYAKKYCEEKDQTALKEVKNSLKQKQKLIAENS